ncbi:unnamed protein product, partial [Didymodactylos carnosus]
GGSTTINSYNDIEIFRQRCQASSVMLCQIAMWNPSIFRKEGLLQLDTVIRRDMFNLLDAYKLGDTERDTHRIKLRHKMMLDFNLLTNHENTIDICPMTSGEIIEKGAKFIRSNYTSCDTPKSALNSYCIKEKLKRPIYRTEEMKPQRIFRTILELDNKRYTTTTWEKNKQQAEQGAAMVCLNSIGIDHLRLKYANR